MYSATKTEPLVPTAGWVRFLGLAVMAGGFLFATSFLDLVGDLPLVADGLLFVFINLCLACGPLALGLLGAAGDGWKHVLGLVGTVISWVGQLFYVTGAFYILAFPEQEFSQPFTPLGALLSGAGMLVLGVAVLAARRLSGWRSFAALPVGLFYFSMIPYQILFRIGQGLPPLYELLGIWGVFWMLLGYAILTEGEPRRREEIDT